MNKKHAYNAMEAVVKSLEVDKIEPEMLQSLHNMITLDTFQSLIPTIQAKIAEIDQYKIDQRKRSDAAWGDLAKKMTDAVNGLGGTVVFAQTPTTPSKNMTSSEDMSKRSSPFFIVDDYRVPHSSPQFWYDNPPKNEKERSAYIFPSTIPSDTEIAVELELYQLESFLIGAKIQIEEMPEYLS